MIAFFLLVLGSVSNGGRATFNIRLEISPTKTKISILCAITKVNSTFSPPLKIALYLNNSFFNPIISAFWFRGPAYWKGFLRDPILIKNSDFCYGTVQCELFDFSTDKVLFYENQNPHSQLSGEYICEVEDAGDKAKNSSTQFCMEV